MWRSRVAFAYRTGKPIYLQYVCHKLIIRVGNVTKLIGNRPFACLHFVMNHLTLPRCFGGSDSTATCRNHVFFIKLFICMPFCHLSYCSPHEFRVVRINRRKTVFGRRLERIINLGETRNRRYIIIYPGFFLMIIVLFYVLIASNRYTHELSTSCQNSLFEQTPQVLFTEGNWVKFFLTIIPNFDPPLLCGILNINLFVVV